MESGIKYDKAHTAHKDVTPPSTLVKSDFKKPPLFTNIINATTHETAANKYNTGNILCFLIKNKGMDSKYDRIFHIGIQCVH